MRSIGLLAGLSGTVMLALGCGGDGGGTIPPENRAPEASFDLPPSCTTHAACNFSSTSSDDEAVTEWNWDFDGDGSVDKNTANATYTYTTAGDFDVSLMVRDAQGLSDTETRRITIAPGNVPPTASFDYSCTAADCSFTSTSSDAAPGTITAHEWTFGDGGTSNVVSPSYRYGVTAPADFTVALTVTDNEGATDTETRTISVIPVNTPPTAGFTPTCNAGNCSFSNTSSDVAPGTITTYAWTFGDGGTANVMNPLHSYIISAPTSFTVTLTVTDNEGATGTHTETIMLTPPPPMAEGCITSGTRVDCALNITARSTVRLKLVAINCDLNKQRVVTPPPIGDQVFLNVCERTAGEELGIFGGPLDELIVFEAGSQVVIRFHQGEIDRNHPVLGPPAGRLEGTFPTWTLSFEDGANPGGPGEPDFIDVVVEVRAVPAP
jgi:PKD repeat protein